MLVGMMLATASAAQAAPRAHPSYVMPPGGGLPPASEVYGWIGNLYWLNVYDNFGGWLVLAFRADGVDPAACGCYAGGVMVTDAQLAFDEPTFEREYARYPGNPNPWNRRVIGCATSVIGTYFGQVAAGGALPLPDARELRILAASCAAGALASDALS